MSTIRYSFVLGFGVFAFVFATSFFNPTPEIVKHAKIAHTLERMALLKTIGDIAIVGGTAILLIALAVGLRWLWGWSGRPMQLRAEDGLFPALYVDRSTILDRLTGQRRLFAHDPNRSGGASLGINIGRNGEISAHGAQVESSEQAAIIRDALKVQKVQAGYRRGPTVAEIKGELGYYDRTPRPAIITEGQKLLPQQTTQPILTLSEAIRQVGGAGDIPLGQQQDGANALAVWKPSTAPHMSILGSTQQGKTSGAGFTIATCAIKHGWRVVILDPEEEGQWRIFQPWAEWTHADEDSVTGHVLAVHSEYERRGQMMVAAGASSFAEMRNERRVLLVIEEYGDLRNRADAAGTLAEFDGAMAQLARRGGKRGFHLLLIDQHHKGSYATPAWPETVARNVHRLSFHQPSNDSGLVGWWDMQSLTPGQFGYKAERYQAWHARPEVERILAGVPRLTGPRILDNVPFGRSVTPNAATPIGVQPGQDAPNGRPALVGDEARQAIFSHLDKSPNASQADIRTSLGTSKGWTHQCWHEWHAAQKAKPPITSQTLGLDGVGREVFDLSSDVGAEAIRRIDWRKVEIK